MYALRSGSGRYRWCSEPGRVFLAGVLAPSGGGLRIALSLWVHPSPAMPLVWGAAPHDCIVIHTCGAAKPRI